ncbi:uncharacterized protein ACIB01_019411 isoform 2-T2 [Guaruba guarouba]
MRDRTRELRQASGSSSEDEEGDDGGTMASTALNPLLQAGRVRAALRALELKVEALEQLQEAALGSPLPPEAAGSAAPPG